VVHSAGRQVGQRLGFLVRTMGGVVVQGQRSTWTIATRFPGSRIIR
jgi:hypothetical protein